MKSKNLKEFSNSQIHEAPLHRHPTRLSRAQTSSALLSTRSDVLTYVCGYKKSGATLLPLRLSLIYYFLIINYLPCGRAAGEVYCQLSI